MQAFINQWRGERVDYDGVFQYQCVDLIKQYLAQEFGLKPGAWGNAIDYWTKTNPGVLTKFDRVAGHNTRAGDIVVLNGLAGNRYGHIGIATGRANGTSLEILEQNGATGDGDGKGGDEVRTRYVPRSRVAGLLRPKGDDMADANDVRAIYKYGPLWRTADDGGVKHYTGKKTDFILTDHAKSAEGQRKAAERAKERAAAAQVPQLKAEIISLKKALEAAKSTPGGGDIGHIRAVVDKIWALLTKVFK